MEKLIKAAQLLEAKAEESKAEAAKKVSEAVAKEDGLATMQLAALEGMRSTIYRDVAAILRKAAEA